MTSGRPDCANNSQPTAVSRRTALLAVGTGLSAALAGCLGVGSLGSGEASLVQRWESQPTTTYGQNHHDFAIDTTDEPRVVAPHSSHSGGDDCRLQAVDASGEAVWDAPVDPADCTPHAVGDVGVGVRDGPTEAFVGTEAGDVRGYDIQTGEETLRVDALDSIGYSAPLVDDFAGGQLLATDFEGGVFGIDNDEVVWSHDLDSRLSTAPFVDDVTGDGNPEIVLAHGTRDDSAISALGVDHERRWHQPLDGTPNSMVRSEVGGESRIAVGTAAGVHCLAAEDGDRRWSDSFEETTAVGGLVEGLLVVGSNDGYIRGLSIDDGTVEWSQSITPDDERRLSAPVVGDGYGDGTPLIAAATYTGAVVVLSASGEHLVSYDHDEGVYVSPQFGDLTGDGSDELVIMDGHGRLAAFDVVDER